MLAYRAYRDGIHGTCGLHDSVAREDPNFTLEDDECPVCASVERALRVREFQENQFEKDYPPGQSKASDGRRTYVQLAGDRP